MREREGNVAALVVGLGAFFMFLGQNPALGMFLLCLGFVYAAGILFWAFREAEPEDSTEFTPQLWWRFWS